MKSSTLIYLILLLFLSSCSQAQNSADELTEKINAARELRAQIQSDPHRPTYHFVSPEGLAMPFDPNGAIYHDGQYHLGFIYQKLSPEGEQQHVWGHAVSTDLFHWTLYPPMLEVNEGDPEIGIFSGGAFRGEDRTPHIIYHALGADGNGVARAIDDDLKQWEKLEENPVLKSPQEGDSMFGKYKAWDPDGWYSDGTYYQIAGGTPTTSENPVPASFWKSKDLIDWEYIGNFIDQDNRMHYDFEDISCPDFFSIGDKHMLLFISHQLGAQYYLGDYENENFHNYTHGRMNWPGGTFFAPEQLQDDTGRNIIVGWVMDLRTDEMKEKSGWSGTMSMPRVVSLSEDGTLQINPPEEVKDLRLGSHSHSNVEVTANQETTLSNISGKALEIKVRIKDLQSEEFGLKVLASPDGREETIIKYDRSSEELVIDFANASINEEIKYSKHIFGDDSQFPEEYLGFTTEQRAPFALEAGEDLELNIFIDHSIIEVFANGRLCLTQRVYPMLPGSSQVKLFNNDENNTVAFDEITAWNMAEANYY